MVGDFYAATLLYRAMVEVDIGAFVEAVVRGLVGGWGEKIMDIRKAVSCQTRNSSSLTSDTHSVKSDTSPC